MSALELNRQQPRCPICCETATKHLRDVFDDRYGQPDLFSLVQCLRCGHCMTSPQLLESALGLLYSTYYPRKQVDVESLKLQARQVSRPLARLKRWWAGTDNQGQYMVRPGERVLDVGCGSGLSLLEAAGLGATVRGIEADPNVARIATELGLQVHIGSLHDEPFLGEKFDLIVLNQVIEHIPEPGLALERLRSRLADGGRIVLVFPNIRSAWCRIAGAAWINWHVPYHLHHFTRETFSQLAQRSGLRIRRWRSITPNLWTLLQLRAMRRRATRAMPSPVWTSAPAAARTTTNQAVRPAARLLRRIARWVALAGFTIPLACLNRLIDSVGYGDSLLVEIEAVK